MRKKRQILYLEGASGISGDMAAAALLDLGASRGKLETALRSLAVDGLDFKIASKRSYGLAGLDFVVTVHGEPDHGCHDHTGHGGGTHPDGKREHEHRNLADVYGVLSRGAMSENARRIAKKIFRIVAEAEAAVHGVPVEEVHFHEVGAIDSIADITAAAVLIDDLGIDDCVVTGLSEGHGTVRCQHGELPVPVPAVLQIAQSSRIALRPVDAAGEMVTPTGIAIAAALKTRDSLPARYRVKKVGVGFGKRDFGRPNLLRAMLLEEAFDPERVWMLESNIDDASGETLGLAMEKIFAAGARDVHFVPCFMKKNRPGTLLRVVADESLLDKLEAVIFETTTTIGIRRFPVERSRMERSMVTLTLPWGAVEAKQCVWGGLVRCYPEYESVKALAEQTGVPFARVWQTARDAADVLVRQSRTGM